MKEYGFKEQPVSEEAKRLSYFEIDTRLLPAVIEKAEKAIRESQVDIGAFESKDFAGSGENIDPRQDAQIAQELRCSWEAKYTGQEKSDKEVATLLEGTLNHVVELYDWLGGASCTISTTAYDDYINGVDMLIVKEREDYENPPENSFTTIATNETLSSSQAREKLEGIKRDIERGHMATVRYFHDTEKEHKGSLRNIPKIVIGLSASNTIDLANILWSERVPKKEVVRMVEHHPCRGIIIEQIRAQLDAFARYAQKCNQPAVAKAYRDARATFDSLDEKNISSFDSDPDIAQKQKEQETRYRFDKVHGAITSWLKDLEHPRDKRPDLFAPGVVYKF